MNQKINDLTKILTYLWSKYGQIMVKFESKKVILPIKFKKNIIFLKKFGVFEFSS